MAWTPEREPLNRLIQLFRDALNPSNVSAQKNSTLMLSQLKSSPDIDNYLAFLLANPQPLPDQQVSLKEFESARSLAATELKNHIKWSYKSKNIDDLAYVRSSSLVALQDGHSMIRKLAGNVITEIVHQGSIAAWPELFSELFQRVQNAPGNYSKETQEAAMNAIFKVCEDSYKILSLNKQGQSPLDFLIPKLVEVTRSPLPKVRADALASLVVFMPQMSPAVLASLDNILVRLSDLSQDPSADVRKYVCRGFVSIAEVQPDKIKPHIVGVIDYMLAQQQNENDPDLALDAAEFWLSSSEHGELRTTIAPYLSKIVPVLLETMVYSAEDIMLLETDEDDADQEDKAEDIKPQFAKSKGQKLAKSRNEKEGKSMDQTNGTAHLETEDGDLSEGEIEEDEDDDSEIDPEDVWNLRKCSAAALDAFATPYPDTVFNVVLPYLIQNLKHPDWPSREAAVLALGAVADGCMKSVIPHLAELVPYLLTLLNDKEPVVRKITCWTLGRYSGWASQLTDPKQIAQFFEPIMEGILQKMLDRNKKVQEAAASAFANLEERAKGRLNAYAVPIVQQFVRCFSSYKDKNMAVLYDCVQTLADSLGSALAQDDVLQILMPAIMGRWNKVSDKSQELFLLLECLSYIAAALGSAFTPFVDVVFSRCIGVMHQNLEEYLAATENPALDEPDKDFLVVGLDLLSAIIQAIPTEKAVSLTSNSQPNFFQLLIFCLEDPNTQVRQSSYALLGDTAIFLTSQLQPYLPTIIPILGKQLDLDRVDEDDPSQELSVINNACWSLGEISMRSEELKAYVDQLSGRLTAITSDHSISESVSQNAAIALGRLGMLYNQQLAPHLTLVAEPFLESMQELDFTEEKDQAFYGFNLMVCQNPQAMEKSMGLFFQAIAAYLEYVRGPNPRQYAKDNVMPLFGRIIEGYRGMISDFDTFIDQLDPSVRGILKEEIGRKS